MVQWEIMPGPYPGYFPLKPIRVGSAQKGYFLKLKVYERDLVEVYKKVGKFVIVACKKSQKG